MWDLAAGPFLAAAGLLVVAGVPKLLDPLPLVRALRAAGMPAGRHLVRAFAAAEVAVGGWALVAPGRLAAALVAAAYLVFTRVRRAGADPRRGPRVVRLLRQAGHPRDPHPPGVLTAAATLTALRSTIDPPRGVWAGVDPQRCTTVGLAVGHRVPRLAGDGRPADHVAGRHPQQRRTGVPHDPTTKG